MWLKKFRQRKLQTLIIFLMITACTVLMAGSFGILTSLEKPYNDFRDETKAPTVKVNPKLDHGKTSQEWISELSKLPSVDRVTELKRHYMEEKILCNGREMEAFLSFLSYNEKVYGNMRWIEGEKRAPKSGECIIPVAFSKEHDIKLNDTLTLTNGEKSYDYKVIAFSADVYSCNMAYQAEILVSELPEGLDTTPCFAIYGKAGSSGQDIIDEYVKSNNGILDGTFDTVEEVIDNSMITEKILGGILLVLSIIVFLVCVMMIRFMIKSALNQDRKTVAIYKTLGYRSKDIMNIYILFYMSLTIAGSVLGAYLSPLISMSFIAKAFENIGASNLSVSWIPRIIVILMMNAVVLLQVYIAIRKLRKVRPVIVLNDRESDLGKRKIRQHPLTKRMSFSPFGMAIRMIQRDRRNTIYVILTCFLCIYMVNIAIACFSNIDSMKTNNYYWLGFDKHDVTVTSVNKDKFDEVCKELQQLDEVERVVKSNNNINTSIRWQKGVQNPNFYSMILETYEGLDMPIVKGHNPRNSNEIVIGNRLANELGKKVGDYIDLYFGADKKISFLIVGTFQSFYDMGRGTRILASALEENGITPIYQEASLYLKKGITPDDFIKRYGKQFANSIKMTNRSEKYENILAMICDPQKAAIGPFMALVVLIGSLSLICIIYLKNIQNHKKYTIYKSIGYSASHLLRMNFYYVGVIATTSIVIALPIFILAFPRMMSMSMMTFGFVEYPVFYNVPHMIAGNLCLFVVFMISVVLSSRSLFRNDMTALGNE
ncbi:MAG TPA: FtsX-like permease family protein [Lachnospiraceae bacterium]|nr:FtsX-like permease family protein [Lachnospiraceae bacterium]